MSILPVIPSSESGVRVGQVEVGLVEVGRVVVELVGLVLASAERVELQDVLLVLFRRRGVGPPVRPPLCCRWSL